MKVWGGFRAAVVTAGVVAIASIAQAQTVEEFYGDTDVTILIGHPPGGSYDMYAQLAAAHIGKFLPGKPTVIVQHMEGGGGSRATAYFYHKAPRDGSMLGLFPETIVHTQIMDPRRGNWDLRKMAYVGSMASVNTAFVIRKGAPAQTIEAMRTTPMNVGCSGRTSQSYQFPAMMKAFGGMQYNMVCGYTGSAAYVLALTRGEVDMVSSAWNNWRTQHKDDFASGGMKIVLQSGLIREPEMADVPLMQETVDDPKIKAVFEFMGGAAPIGRALLAPQEIPDDRLAALRTAFDRMVKDADYIADAGKRDLQLSPLPGVDAQAQSDKLINTDPEIVKMAIEGLGGVGAE